MKATKIRACLIATALAALVVPAVVALLGVDSPVVFADTVTPSGTFTAALCSGTKVTIKLGTATVTCTTSSTGGTVPSPTGAGQPVCGAVNAPTLSGCTVSPGGFSASCSSSGSWNLCVTPTTATLTGGTVSCTAHPFGANCSANSGAVTLNGTWSNSTSSSNFTNQSVSVTTSGGFPCPSGNTATFSADYCTSPALTVTDP